MMVIQQVIGRYELRVRAKSDEPIIRFETKLAEQMQIDWIEFPQDSLIVGDSKSACSAS